MGGSGWWMRSHWRRLQQPRQRQTVSAPEALRSAPIRNPHACACSYHRAASLDPVGLTDRWLLHLDSLCNQRHLTGVAGAHSGMRALPALTRGPSPALSESLGPFHPRGPEPSGGRTTASVPAQVPRDDLALRESKSSLRRRAKWWMVSGSTRPGLIAHRWDKVGGCQPTPPLHERCR